MKKPQILASFAVATMIVGAPVLAQDDGADGADGPDISPVEIYTCNYMEGKGPSDLQAVIDGWNAWMDENDNSGYFAATMTPYYHGAETFDVAWIGATDTAAEMGAGVDAYNEVGGEQDAAFAGVVDCDTHQNVATVMVKQPPEPTTPDDVVVSFTDCSITDGKSLDDVFSALDEWTAYQIERGYHNGTWAWFPVYGAGGESTFDFKLVESYDNHTDMGKDWDKMAGGDYIKSGELLGSVVSCDTARVYEATIHRDPGKAE